MTRYDALLNLIALIQPKTILEVGTWNGNNAARMTLEAKKYHPQITYIGFDLFETATEETDAVEFNVKKHSNLEQVKQKLELVGASVHLNIGDTKETLREFMASNDWPIDFAYIDGGHSLETIESDYNNLKHVPFLVLDDYYEPDAEGKCPDITKYGCNQLVSRITDKKIILLPHADQVRDGGYTRLVLVI